MLISLARKKEKLKAFIIKIFKTKLLDENLKIKIENNL
jgi:hypothetical protein